MSRPKIHVFTENENKYKRRTYTDVNPEKSDAEILEFANITNNLTENTLGEVYKVDNNIETDLTPITLNNIRSILNGSFTPFADNDSISADDINDFLGGNL